MALTSEQRLVQYTLTGSGQVLAVPFKFADATELKVTKTVAGVNTVLVLTTDYSVTGGGIPYATGNVTLVAGIIGDVVTIEGAATETQPNDLNSGGAPSYAALTGMLDRLTTLVQQVKLQADRSVRASNTDQAGTLAALPAARLSSFLFFNTIGQPTTYTYNQLVADITATLAMGTPTAFASANDVIGGLNIACWGDSLTSGTGAGSPNGPPWPTVLQTSTNYGVFQGGVGGQTSTQIRARMQADTAKFSYSAIIWAGANNLNQQATVLADIAAMVASLGHNRYLVISEHWGGGDSTAQAQGLAINAQLAAIYGSHYLDTRTYLWSLYNPGIPQDVIDHANNDIPSSLRLVGDQIHLNTAGNAAVSALIVANITNLLQLTGKVVTPVSLLGLFQQPAAFGSVTPNAGTFTTLVANAAIDCTALSTGALQVPNGGLYVGANAIIGGKLTLDPQNNYTTVHALWFGIGNDMLFRNSPGNFAFDVNGGAGTEACSIQLTARNAGSAVSGQITASIIGSLTITPGGNNQNLNLNPQGVGSVVIGGAAPTMGFSGGTYTQASAIFLSQSDGHLELRSAGASGNIVFAPSGAGIVQANGALSTTSTLTTAGPSGGSGAGALKFGTILSGSFTADLTKAWEIDVGGTRKRVALLT